MPDFYIGTAFKRLLLADGGDVNGKFTLNYIGNVYGHQPSAATKLCYYDAPRGIVIPYESVIVAYLADKETE
jgi:hypothetical protein